MSARKMRIELFDNEGNRYFIAFEGKITRDKALRLLDLVELLGGVPEEANPGASIAVIERSKNDKVLFMIKKNFPMVWFSSREVQSAYEQEYKEAIGLSTVATYLARMTNKGILVKTGASNRLKYRMAPSFPHVALKQQIP